MKVSLRSHRERVKIPAALAEDFAVLANKTTTRATIFLSAVIEDGDYVIDGWYIPSQGATAYYNTIDVKELVFLGGPTKITDESRYYGILRVGGGVGEIVQSDIEFFTKSFNGIKSFFGINVSKEGTFYVFTENPVCDCINDEIIYIRNKSKRAEKIIASVKEAVRTSGTYTYTTTVRTVYKPPDIITKGMKWGDVV